jgi:hypothetical protein
MSGSIDALQILPQLVDGSLSGSLLSALYGGSGSAVGTPASALQALTRAESNQSSDIAATAAQPQTARDIAAFIAGVTAANSVDAALSNPAVLKVLLTANGLGDQIGYMALAQKALTSNLADSSSLANTLPDTSWRTAAQTYQFATAGLSVLQQPSVLQTVANAYAEVQWRDSLDTANPGLSNALTFRSEAASITSVDQILGDPIMRDVVTTALGLPLEIAIQPLDAQEKAITSQLDINQFKSPQFVEQFIQRYLITKAANATSSASASLDSLATAAAGLVV